MPYRDNTTVFPLHICALCKGLWQSELQSLGLKRSLHRQDDMLAYN